MYYTREQHIRFLQKELNAISESYLRLIKSQAISLLESNLVYVTQFVKINITKDGNGNGQLLLKFKGDKGIPRKNEYFTAVVLDNDMCLPRNWGGLSWVSLRKYQISFSQVHCVWQGKSDEKGFLLCGFKGLSIEMADFLTDKHLEGCVIVLGPKEPPLDYYINLMDLVCQKECLCAGILDFDVQVINWEPVSIRSENGTAGRIRELLYTKNELIIQGPPGTGKTYLMASLVSLLLKEGKSVLVTSLTNRALIELVQKPSLKSHLDNGEVMKTNTSVDELTECRGLVPVSSDTICSIPGKLTLSTFYVSSGWAKIIAKTQPFDYIIMDESSQALFAMTAAIKQLAKKTLWIGDQNQIPPIVVMSDESVLRNDYSRLVNGFQTLCDNFRFPSFILTETHRLLPAAAKLTSKFYHVPLTSAVNFEYTLGTAGLPYLGPDGGTSIVFRHMKNGGKADLTSCNLVIKIVDELLDANPDLSIAVLSKFRDTVRMLQRLFLDSHNTGHDVLIDTIGRVQGMTCDVCVFLIPNTMVGLSLDRNQFNVATSRAKQHTIIIADPSVVHAECDSDVRSYLKTVDIRYFT